jgi:DNA invertase Pin-like site-specific DNA recombinase
MRAVIYARYSSDLQREASIEDQLEVCRRYAISQGWTIVETYTDAAISGASRFRPGFQKLIAEASKNKFDIVICEAIDRLGRRLADTADLQDQLSFHKIRLFTPTIGEITTIHVAVMGMMAQIALKDLGEKTKRGQMGRVLKGRIPSGITTVERGK